MAAGLTPFQTVGPFLHIGLRAGLGPMVWPSTSTSIAIAGRLVDGAGEGIPDGVLEFWASACDGLGRVGTAAEGHYLLETALPPTRIDADGGVHAPHFAVRVLGRGIQTAYLTRVYFGGQRDNDRDVVLLAVPAERRATLVAMPAVPGAASEYHFDIVVQGERETVFFDF